MIGQVDRDGVELSVVVREVGRDAVELAVEGVEPAIVPRYPVGGPR